MTTGDIFWVDLRSDGTRTQAGRRPCVVLQNQSSGQMSPLVLMVPLTTALSAARFGSSLLIQPTPENGLPTESLALIFQLRAVDKRTIQTQIGILDENTLRALFVVLDELTGRT